MVGGRPCNCVFRAVASGVGLALSACTYWGPPPPETPAPPWEEDDAVQAALYHPDTQIAMRLLDALARDATVSGEPIDVNVQDGVVTLLGSVSDARSRDRALDLAEGVRGVRAVYDRLTLQAGIPEVEVDHEP